LAIIEGTNVIPDSRLPEDLLNKPNRTKSASPGLKLRRRGQTNRSNRTRTESDSPVAGTWLRQLDTPLTCYYLVIGATVLLLSLGLIMVLSSSAVEAIAVGRSPYAQFFIQTRYAMLGLIGLVIASRIPVKVYRILAWPALIVAIVLQSLTLVPGIARSQGGNTGWIGVGSFTMQPAEVGKLALALWLGAVLSKKPNRFDDLKEAIFPAIPGALAVICLILTGHDLGTALVTIIILAAALWIAGVPMRLLTVCGGVGGAVVAWVFIFAQESSNRLSRIMATYGSTCDKGGPCYQSLHGRYALGTGGIFGVGLGASREKWRYLPEAQNDFIFAVIGEELGLLGTLLVLALFIILGIAMIRLVKRHPDPFVAITTTAVAAWVVGQAFINIGVVLGVLPVIGLPLPLVSAGGSALVTTLGALGMVISFARSAPGAREALAARSSVVRRSFAVVSRGRFSKVGA